MVDSSLGCFLWFFMKKTSGKMGRIQNRDFDIEADQLGLFPSRPLSHTRPLVNSALESTRPLVNSALGQLGQVYSACCSITKGDVHVLICQNGVH